MATQMQATNDNYDVDARRKDFPILDQQINEHPLIYLDTAATAQKPKQVIDAISHFYLNDYANVHRGLHTLSERSTIQFEAARENVKHFIHAADFHEIVFVRGATEAINLVASSFVGPRIEPGEEILITEMEHHSNIVPWQMLTKKTGAVLSVVPMNDAGEITLEAVEKAITPKTRFLSIGHISNALGSINPIKKIIALAHANDVLVMVDGCQAAPHMQIDVQDLDCDFYAFSGHKMYAPTGIGVLYGKAKYLDMMPPYQGGGEMILHVSFEKTEYNTIPHKFEAGTPNITGAIGLSAAIDYIKDIGLENIRNHEQSLIEHALELSKNVKGLGYIGSAQQRAPIFSFVLQNVHAHDIGTVLNSLGIAVRSGHHCAMPAMDHFQVPASTRASFGLYNTHAEVEALFEAIDRVEQVFGK